MRMKSNKNKQMLVQPKSEYKMYGGTNTEKTSLNTQHNLVEFDCKIDGVIQLKVVNILL